MPSVAGVLRGQRACQVRALPHADAEDGGQGSGVLVGDGLVLTARHVVHPHDLTATVWWVRVLGDDQWRPAEVAKVSPDTGVAVLRVDSNASAAVAARPVRLGRLRGLDAVTGRATGFPAVRVKEAAGGGLVAHPEPVRGRLEPETAGKGGLLSLHTTGGRPQDTGDDESPWAGMSGAGVFCGPWLVGVVSQDPAGFSGDRLEVTPLAALDAADPVWGVLPVDLGGLEVADRPRALAEPYWPTPPGESVRLLRARYGIVPFTGREADLADLAGWCAADAQVAVRVITGAGGQGKTRLAAQLCDQLAADGWHAGFLAADAPDRILDEAIEVRGATLIVVDYADARVADVVRVVNRARWSPDPVRLLLLARHADRWWTTLAYEADDHAPFEAATVTRLAPVALDETARVEAFDQAVDAISRHLDRNLDEVTPPGLTDATFETLLFVHLAALSAVDPEPSDTAGDAPSIAHGLLDDALRREDTKIWKPDSTAQPALAGATTRRRAVTVGTATTPTDEAAATRLLQAIPELEAHAAVSVAQWLHDLYAGDGYINPLEPDRLGEHLLAASLTDLPDLINRLVAGDDLAHLTRLLTVLTRAADHYPTARDALQTLLDTVTGRIITAGDLSTGQLLAAAVDTIDTPATATAVLAVIPQHTTALRDVAVAAIETLLRHQRQPTERAGLLNDLSVRLSEVGRGEDALTAITEAVEAYRALADTRPNAFLPNLAMALNNQSTALADLRRREDALAAITEAVEAYRALADARPDAFLPNLARSLNNQSNALADLRRREDALAAVTEAVEAFRALADARPDAFLPDLAMALNNQSLRLADVGRRKDALTAVSEAVAIRRALADARPDAFLPDLARALNNQFAALADLRRREDALAAITEAVEAFRALADARPDAFLPDLARSLNNQSNALANLGRRQDALTAITEAVARVLPVLERGWYTLPDGGRRLTQAYIQRCSDLDREPDEDLIARLVPVLRAAGYQFDDEGE